MLDITNLYNNPSAKFRTWLLDHPTVRRSEMSFLRDGKIDFGPVPLAEKSKQEYCDEYISKYPFENEILISCSFFYDGVTINQRQARYKVGRYWHLKSLTNFIEFDTEADLIEFRILFQEHL